jgi:hypothetical protein
VDDEPDLHARLIENLEKCNTETDQRDFPSLHFKSVPIDHPYVIKKPNKEFQSTDGILKYSTLYKHYDLLPSVIVITVSFCVDWHQSGWVRLGDEILEKINHIKEITKGRDVKLMVVAVKTGMGQQFSDLLDERLHNLRRQVGLDNNRTFVNISLSDVASPLSLPVRKLSRCIREISCSHYNVSEKRARFMMKTASTRGASEGILTARYSYKLAYFLSFQGLKLQSFKYYKQCFEALLGIVYHIDEDLVDQLKTVAEFAHFKICSMLLETGSLREAIAQFMIHITTFTKVYSRMIWRHYSWISDQYSIFLQLLDNYKISTVALQIEGTDRYFFSHNAVRFAVKRQESYQTLANDSTQDDNELEKQKQYLLTFVILPSKYIGSLPVLIDPVLGANPANISGISSPWAKTPVESNTPIGSTREILNDGNDINNLNNDNLSTLLPPPESLNIFSGRILEDNYHPQGSELVFKPFSHQPNKMNMNEIELTTRYLEAIEEKQDLNNLIMNLIKRCNDLLTMNTNSITHRRKSLLNIFIYEQYIISGNIKNALEILNPLINLFIKENWIDCAIPLLKKKLNCCLLLGLPYEYLVTTYTLLG